MYNNYIYLSDECIGNDDKERAKETGCSVEPYYPVGDDEIEDGLEKNERQFAHRLGQVVGREMVHATATLLSYDSVLRWNCTQ